MAFDFHSPAAFQEWFSAVDNVLLDCDGVLWAGSSPIPGAAAAVARMRHAGKRVFFVSNNSTKTRDQYVTQLAAHGISASASEVVASAYVTAQYMSEAGYAPGDRVYVIGESGLHEELRAVGLDTVGLEDGDKHVKPAAFTREHLDSSIRAVIVGLDSKFNYYKVAMAASYLRYNEGCKLIATNADRTLPVTDMMLPGSGTVVHAVAFASEHEPDAVVGKPSPKMLEVLRSVAHLDLSRTLMVGDRMNTDIEFGKRGGLLTLMVLTGVSTRAEAEAEAEDSLQRPHKILPSLADVVALLDG